MQLYLYTAPACPHCGFAPVKIDQFLAWHAELASDCVGFKAEYFDNLAQLEANNFWFRARNALILWALEKYFPHFESLMEIGCGTGFVLTGIATRFPERRLLGTEIFASGLRFAKQRLPGITLMQMDARRIPYEDEFDVVGAFDVLEHIEEDKTVFQNMFRAVKPGGGILVSVPQHQWLWSSVDDYACHVRRYSAGELHAKIETAGFEILRSTSFVSLLLPAMYLSRQRGRRGRLFDPLDEFRINPHINRLFEKVLAVERGVIRAGLDLPVGGSRLVVARRPTH